jgi:hypothetical protein
VTREQLRGLVVCERKISGTKLMQPLLELQTRERKRWISARDEKDRERSRQTHDQMRKRGQCRTGCDLLHVIEHQHRAFGARVEVFEDPVEHHSVRAMTVVEIVDRAVGPQCMGDQLAESPGRVVTRVEREPGAVGGHAVIREPVGQQRGLAGAGEPGNEHRFPRTDAGARIVQARPAVPRCREARHGRLGAYGKVCDRHFDPTAEDAQQGVAASRTSSYSNCETTSPPRVNFTSSG